MKRIRELREECGVTQEELAFALGITQQRVSKLLSGKSHFYPEEIKKCANYFHVTSDYLLELSDYREEVSVDMTANSDFSESQRRILIYLFGLISDKQRKLVLELMESMSGKE